MWEWLYIHAGEMDQEVFARELDSFVPGRVLDSHTHIWSPPRFDPTDSKKTVEGFDESEMTIQAWRQWMDELLPGRRQGGLMIPGIFGDTLESTQRQNEFVSREALSDPLCRPIMFISPDMDPDYVRQEVTRLNVSGLKCYHTQSARKPTWDAEIPEYLPEEHVRVANEQGLCITLHMVKSRAVADPSNQHWIRTYCERYPNIKMVLAHAARSFNPIHAIEGMRTLSGLTNLWCDMSAVTEVGACEAIIDALGHERLMWGSDFPVSAYRSKCIAVGLGFVWVNERNLDLAEQVGSISSPLVLHGLESLRVLKQAAWHRRLTDPQVEDIFYGNLARLLEIED